MTPTPPPPLPVTCRAIAASFRQHARQAYGVSDQRRGDYLTAMALRWELYAESGDLEELN